MMEIPPEWPAGGGLRPPVMKIQGEALRRGGTLEVLEGHLGGIL